ncbi:MAG: hypothetical protein KJT01_12510 [Gemmatimonadetes bacterium]|nr:hypothetical protein [Gemmatimonadota bacterium]
MPTTSVFRRPTSLLAMVGASLFAAACTSDPFAPSVELERRSAVLPKPAVVKVLTRTTPLQEAERGSLTITAKQGGTIRLPNAGLLVTVPAGAIKNGTLTITVTADPGKSLSYDFQPHGTVFEKALTLAQDLDKTTWRNLSTTTLWGAYFPEKVDDANSLATITETFSVRILGSKSATGAAAAFDIWHFSGYTISTGRADGEPNSSLGM